MEDVKVELKSWEDMTEEERGGLFKRFVGGRARKAESTQLKATRQRRWLRAQRAGLDPSIKRDYGIFCPKCGFKNVYCLREVRKCRGCGMEFILLGNRFDFIGAKEV